MLFAPSLPMNHFLALPFLLACSISSAATVWNFSNTGDPLAPVSGPGTMAYHDPGATNWAAGQVSFAKASVLGLPALPGGDADVMVFPACTPQQGFVVTHGENASGVYGESLGLVSSYTLVMDVLYPASSNGWRALWQSSLANSDDADFFINNAVPTGGLGTLGNYRGAVTVGEWHRIVVTMRAAPGEGHCQRYIDGQFVGGVGTTGNPLEQRHAMESQFLLFTDEDNETAPGYCASVAFLNFAMLPAEVAALGGPHAGGALTPGAAPAPLSPPMARRTGVIAHRGGAFNRAPDNTLSGIRAAIADGVQGIEVDTRVTADGVCIAFHDSTVDRTTNGTGAVEAMTLAELKTLDAGSWYHPSFTGEQVAALSEVLTEAKGKCFIFLDIKTAGQAPAIRAAVDAAVFPQQDLWLWTTTSEDVAAMQAELPDAVYMWGAPSGSWSTDPNYFTDLKTMGVDGFSFGAGNGSVDSYFCARAKEEGMRVEIFTILDPDAMRQAALSGVDFVENDYPSVMNALQPVQTAAASSPFPANGATEVPTEVVLRWVTGQNAVQRRVYFGTTPPGADLGVRTSDLLARTGLAAATTYYWRVDEMTAGGVTTQGPVWSFTTVAAAATPLAGLWLFDRPDDPGHATIGSDLQIEGATPQAFSAVSDDAGFTVSGAILTSEGVASRLRSVHGIGANGGGTYTNRYSIVADVYSPPASRTFYRSFLQTDPNNGNDGDYFLRDSDSRIGTAALGYGPAVDDTRWTRIVFSVDLQAAAASSVIRTHLNGGAPFMHTGLARDGRYSLDTSVFFFTDNDGENPPIYVGMLALFAGPLSLAQVEQLGAVRSEGLYARPSLQLSAAGAMVDFAWPATPGYLLQKSADLLNWTNLEETISLGAWSLPRDQPHQFFRLAPR